MMSTPKRATRLEELAAQLMVEPLRPGDRRYVDLSAGRGSKELQRMAVHLGDFSAEDNRFAHVAFTGHRGSGKSTELYRLEHGLGDRFFALHLFTDESLLQDCDYTHLMLWLVEALAREFAEQDMPLRAGLVDQVTDWFAARTVHQVEKVKKEIQLEAEVRGESKGGIYWLSLKLMARLKSMIVGSTERRKEVRSELQRYASELIHHVNLLLDDAARTLRAHGRPADVLIVQDNLDRLKPDPARRLFFDNGDLLKALRAHVVYTVPVAMVLAPWNIGSVFESHFSMPSIKVRSTAGRTFRKGVDAVLRLLEARMETEKIFVRPKVARDLVMASGGSVRDLMRLLQRAQLAARVEGKEQIDGTSAREAITRTRLDFEQLLIPGHVYFPLLAQIHHTKRDWFRAETTAENVRSAREFFAELLFNGSVLEYNGERNWYDAHPIVQQIAGFQDALREIRQDTPGDAGD